MSGDMRSAQAARPSRLGAMDRNMFGWLRKKDPGALYPEALWVATLSDDRITVTDPNGEMLSVEMSDLSAVAIETNDTGPSGADFWWLLFGRHRAFACAI